MSLSVTAATVPHEPAETRRLLLLIWGVTVAIPLLTGPGAVQNLSTDDAMRLVQVRDLIGGQGWFDLTQYRLNPPDGVAMHWSRLIDLPIAILLRAAESVLPTPIAERMVLSIWPAVLLLVLLLGIVRIARQLADDTAARLALIFAAITAPVLQHFRPGAIDHHGAQLALMVWSIAFMTRGRSRDGTLAGIACALSLAIGQEMAPAIAAIAGFVTLRWIVCGEPCRDSTAAFGTAFAAGILILFVATVPPAHYTVTTCDALSIAQMVIGVGGGLGLVVAAALRPATVFKRAASAVALGALLALIAVAGFPQCLRDPFAELDPRFASLWLSNVTEARSIASMMRGLPHEVPAHYGLPFVALALGLYRSRRETGARQWAWIGVTVALAMTTLVTLWWVRGSAAANALALAVVPAALVQGLPMQEGRAVFLGLGRAALVVAALVSPIAMIAVGRAAAWTAEQAASTRRPVVIASGKGTCQSPSDYAPLARLPKGRVLAFIDAGPMILAQTQHSVFAAPYHRNSRGNVAMLDVFLGPPNEAGVGLAALGVDYVAFCPGSPERHNYAAAAPVGFAAALSRGEIPDALERVPIEGTDLELFRRR